MNPAIALTVLRFLCVPLVIYLLYRPGIWAAVVFVLAALTDWLDGYIARRYRLVSNLGKFLDPLADKVLVLSVLVIFAVQQRIDVYSVIFLLARELIIMGFRAVAAGKKIIIAASFLAKLKTAVQMTSIFLLLMQWPLGLDLYYISVLLALYTLGEYVWDNRKVLKG